MDSNQLDDIFGVKFFDYLEIRQTIPDEYKLFSFPENYEHNILLFNTKSFNEKNLCEIIVYNRLTYTEVKQSINIWEHHNDYWFRHGVINNNIFILDYSGLKVYDMNLQLLYHYYDSKLYESNIIDYKLVYNINDYILISNPGNFILCDFNI